MDHGLPRRLEEVRLAAGDGALVGAEVLLGGPPLHGAGEAVAAARQVVEVAPRRAAQPAPLPQPAAAVLALVHRVVVVAARLLDTAEAAEAALAAKAVVVLK